MHEGALTRYGWPEEVAKTVGFLVTDDSSYITGQVLRIDGGRAVVPGLTARVDARTRRLESDIYPCISSKKWTKYTDMLSRLLHGQVLEALNRQAAVAIVGPRQSGKTTLAHQIGNPAQSHLPRSRGQGRPQQVGRAGAVPRQRCRPPSDPRRNSPCPGAVPDPARRHRPRATRRQWRGTVSDPGIGIHRPLASIRRVSSGPDLLSRLDNRSPSTKSRTNRQLASASGFARWFPHELSRRGRRGKSDLAQGLHQDVPRARRSRRSGHVSRRSLSNGYGRCWHIAKGRS